MALAHASLSASSVAYHDIFDYPLRRDELKKWECKLVCKTSLETDGKYYFLKGRSGLVKKRLQRQAHSEKLLKRAKDAAGLLSKIPTVQVVAVTGSLAMMNARKGSDIDLLIITNKGTLWTTRAIVLVALALGGFGVRRAGSGEEAGKLCLNLWLDESDLGWDEENIYTAHEIAQVIPLVNKNNTYQKFLAANRWILNYWPHAVKITGYKSKSTNYILLGLLEPIFRLAQYLYMKSKITSEIISPSRAIFHPRNLSKKIMGLLHAR